MLNQSINDWFGHSCRPGMEFEHSSLKIPTECLSQVFRKTQKQVTKDVSTSIAETSMLGAESADQTVERLLELERKLQGLKETVNATACHEQRYLGFVDQRVNQLARSTGMSEEQRARAMIPRVVAEAMLSQGLFDTADVLIRDAQLEGQLDVDVYRDVRAVANNLRQGSCDTALQWCAWPLLP